MRTISVDHQNLDSVEEAKAEIKRQIQSFEKSSSSLETPISMVLESRFIDERKCGINATEEGFKEVGDKIDKNRHINAKTAADEPEEAKQVASVCIDKALRPFFSSSKARQTKQSRNGVVALVAEESDIDLAAKAWYSVSYLYWDDGG